MPLRIPRIPKGGANAEGLTWKEWEAAARFGGAKPASMSDEVEWSRAWACGVDPTEMGRA